MFAGCCESGIHDSSFNCCSKGSTLDRNGDCCETAVDVCGQCNGSAVFIDALGKCCEVKPKILFPLFLPNPTFVDRVLWMLQDCVVRVEMSMSVGSAMDLECPVISNLCSVF